MPSTCSAQGSTLCRTELGPEPSRPDYGRAMRLVTWNTLWRFGEWQPRQGLLQDGLMTQNADVVLLQETWPAQARELAAACGMQVLGFSGGHFDQQLSSVPVDAEFGNAILARSGEIVLDEPFPAPGDPAPRRLLVANIDGRYVATSHLSHMAEAGERRAEQLRRIVAMIGGVGGANEPFVFGGDCNLLPHSDEHRVAVELGLRDLWADSHPGDHGPTMVPDNPEIFSVEWMDDRNGELVPAGTGVRLDYLWASEGVECRSIERFGAGGAVDRSDGNAAGIRWASDHLGLVAEFD